MRDEDSFNTDIPTTDLIISTLFPNSHIDKAEKRQTTTKAYNERSQLTHIFQSAIFYKRDRQTLEIYKYFYQDIQLVWITHNISQILPYSGQ